MAAMRKAWCWRVLESGRFGGGDVNAVWDYSKGEAFGGAMREVKVVCCPGLASARRAPAWLEGSDTGSFQGESFRRGWEL